MQCSNLRELGFSRDRAILRTLEEYKALDTDQIRLLHFLFRYGQRKAQDRLLKLHQRGKLARERTLEGTYAYYLERPGKLQHQLAVNWVRLWAHKRKTWGDLHSWSYEQNYGLLQCDGFVAYKNTRGEFNFFFVEVDRGTNPFDKVQIYGRLFETEGYTGRWWANLTKRFPAILVATVSPRRAAGIKELIQRDNSAGLEFKVMLLNDIKREVIGKCF